MSCDVTLAGAPLAVRVNRSARRLRLRIDPRTGGLTLTVPPRVSRRRALEWAAGHADWAEQSLRRIPEPLRLVPGSMVPVRGEPHRIDWSATAPRRVASSPGVLHVGGPQEGVEQRILRWLRAEARALLADETRAFADVAGVVVAQVSVGDAVSRWGSCSSAGAIRYSWRLIMAPDFVRRATVAHEVAHRLHMDHSPRFYACLRDLLGSDPKPARDWLRREGAGLHRIGRPPS